MNYSLSNHALLRQEQRNISDEDVCFVLTYGYWLPRTGIIFCQMRWDCLPRDKSANYWRRLVGVSLLLCKCGDYIITIKRDDFKRDKRKAKYTDRQQVSTCPCCGYRYRWVDDDSPITYN